jgi:glutamate/tyrosine decarboxylase-like PLP-dependent enzyme
VYHGDPGHVEFLNRVYAAQSQSNPLHPDLWPSATKFEAEIVAMTASMLGAAEAPAETPVTGTVSSGGTESILLAMKAYRDHAREHRGVAEPEIVAPVTAHAAFDKASQYFGMPLMRVPVGGGCTVDLAALAAAITGRTAVVVASAPAFPHGMIDPVPEVAALAAAAGAGCHVDACLGGFVLPWAERLHYQVPPFDFRLPGVTSMSADTHKYGYAAKGSSVVLYRGRELRQFQYYTVTDWPGGLYLSPTFAGSRPGALSAACWAAMVSIGERGYTEAARRILGTGARIRDGIAAIPGLRVLGGPLWVIAFAADDGLDVYQVMENMSRRGWSLNGLQRPAAVHIAVTLRHARPGVADRFLADLAESAGEVRASPGVSTGMAPVYGMAASLDPGAVHQLLAGYLDLLYEV